jgi:hypothetical protein
MGRRWEIVDPEMLVIAACCRWPRGEAVVAAIERAVSRPLDWNHFTHLVRRHRVAALVWNGLRHAKVDLPGYVARTLAHDAAAIAAQNLANAAEEARLYKAFSEAGIGICLVKGTTLGALAYDTISLKAAWDIDLLIEKRDTQKACALLTDFGYERKVPDSKFSEAQFRRWVNNTKETLWINPQRGVAVELHTALVDNAELRRAIGSPSSQQMVKISDNICLPTLVTERLFLYLMIHGALHHWSRIKWLADMSALALTEGIDFETYYRSASKDSPMRTIAVAIILCDRLLGLKVNRVFMEELESDFRVRILSRVSLLAMDVSRKPPTRVERLVEFAYLLVSFFLVERGWLHSWAELRQRAFFPYSPSYLFLPTWLWPIVTLLQMPRLIVKRLRLKLA